MRKPIDPFVNDGKQFQCSFVISRMIGLEPATILHQLDLWTHHCNNFKALRSNNQTWIQLPLNQLFEYFNHTFSIAMLRDSLNILVRCNFAMCRSKLGSINDKAKWYSVNYKGLQDLYINFKRNTAVWNAIYKAEDMKDEFNA